VVLDITITALIFAVVFGLVLYTVVRYRGRPMMTARAGAIGGEGGGRAPVARPMWDGSRTHHSW
jgi:hypothetical protein